jgi:hypothetical protein
MYKSHYSAMDLTAFKGLSDILKYSIQGYVLKNIFYRIFLCNETIFSCECKIKCRSKHHPAGKSRIFRYLRKSQSLHYLHFYFKKGNNIFVLPSCINFSVNMTQVKCLPDNTFFYYIAVPYSTEVRELAVFAL